METAKEKVNKILDTLPDDSSFEDIQYHICVRSKIEQDLKDIEEGSMLSLEEVERKMTKKII